MISDDIFLIFALDTDCEYTLFFFFFLSQDKKNIVYLVNPTLPCIKCGLPGCSIHRFVNMMDIQTGDTDSYSFSSSNM